MDAAFDIPDSTDWLNTPLKDFSTLENALHCQICKEFYDTPMITSCSHTFCSKCIRTSLSTDGKCPACRAADQASKLRNNWVLQEVVATFLAARPAALEVARREQEATTQSKKPGKRKRIVLDSDDIVQAEQDGRTTRSKSRRIATSQSSQADPIEIDDSEDDEYFEPDEQSSDGLVDCPLGCGKRMKIEAVEPHLDRCEEERKQESRAKSRTPVNGFGSSRPAPTQSSKPQDRISELNYSLLTETKLKQKLGELGIPNWGAKSLLIKRHTEWVNLWNANCDSSHPRGKRELLHELDTWERTQGGRAPTVNGVASTLMRKDFDGTGWANKNRSDFSRLIAEAQRKKSNPALEDERPKETSKDESVRDANATDSPPAFESSKLASPYDNDPEAIASIQHTEPLTNTGFVSAAQGGIVVASPPGQGNGIGLSTNRPTLLEDPGLGITTASSRDEHTVNVTTGVPCDIPHHLQTSPLKKVPMFALPQEAMRDSNQ